MNCKILEEGLELLVWISKSISTNCQWTKLTSETFKRSIWDVKKEAKLDIWLCRTTGGNLEGIFFLRQMRIFSPECLRGSSKISVVPALPSDPSLLSVVGN